MRLSLLIFVIIVSSSPGLTRELEQKWTHEMGLPSKLEIKWIVTDPNWITMEMSAPTQGYLGIGFSPTGSMAGSDIILGWVDDDGTPHLKDYHGTHNGAPVEDDQQDIELISADQTEKGTKFVFRRKWDTCDEKHDILIGCERIPSTYGTPKSAGKFSELCLAFSKEDTMKFIWAVSPTDPRDNNLHWHGKGLGRGVRSIFMKHQGKARGFPDEDPDYPGNSNVKHWDIRMDQYIVPKVNTNYQCKIFKFPKLNKKHHVIAHRPLIADTSAPYVHHINVFRCTVPESLGKTAAEIFEPYLTHPGAECYTDDTPKPWKEFCFALQVAVGVGTEGDILPDHLGDAIEGAEDGATYLKLEVHYDNPLRLNLNDNSGIRIFYTDELRPYEIAMLFTGHRRTPFMTIPPYQDRFKITGFCAPDCTKNGFPKEGIKIFSVLLHAHLTGRSIILRHIRQGKELKPIAYDNRYDFSYQQYRLLPEDVTVLPGDELVVECDFETSGNKTFMFGGLSTSREMCEAFVLYYPKSTLIDCRSQPEFYNYFDALNIKNVSGTILDSLHLPYDPTNIPVSLRKLALADDSYVLEYGKGAEKVGDVFEDLLTNNPDNYRYKITVYDRMNNLDWQNDDWTHKVEEQWTQGPHYMHCAASAGRKVDSNGHVKYMQKYEPYKTKQPVSRHCSLGLSNGGDTATHSLTTMLVSVLVSTTLMLFR